MQNGKGKGERKEKRGGRQAPQEMLPFNIFGYKNQKKLLKKLQLF